VKKSVPASLVNRRSLAVAAIGLYWVLLFTLTHLPKRPGPTPLRTTISRLDKLGHAGAFAVLAMLACVVFSTFGPVKRFQLFVIGVALAAYGAIDEFTQGWVPHRTPDLLDWIADVVGILAGMATFLVVRQLIRHRQSAALCIKADSRQ
jgi:VanZ family protein